MASIKLTLDTRTARKDGTFPLKIGVSHNRYFQISLDVHLLPEQWIDGAVVFPAPQAARAKQLNEYIQARLGHAQSTLRRLSVLGELSSMTDKELRRQLDTRARAEKTEEKTATLVSERFQSFADRCKTPATAESYRSTLSVISRYYDTGTLTLEEITLPWLKNFESRLIKDGLAVNSVARYFCNIRAVYNDAIDYNLVSLAAYPFRRFRITHEKTAKRSLTLEQLRALRDYPCEPSQEKYRDLFLLIFYLGGINLVDLLHLKEITNGRIEYRRAKTGVLCSIRVEPQAQAIIDRYRGRDQLLFPLDRYAGHEDFLRRMNRGLRSIGTFEMVGNAAQDPRRVKKNKKQITPAFPGLSTYVARHTVATLMAEIDIPMETIGKVLGHSDGKNVTAIYVKFDQKKIDDAMRRVIDYVNGPI